MYEVKSKTRYKTGREKRTSVRDKKDRLFSKKPFDTLIF